MPHPTRTHQRAQCVAVGAALPERRLTNADFTRTLDTSDEWIVSHTGIRERRIVAQGQTLSSLAVAASRQCLERGGLSPKDLDGIIVATISGDYVMPATANLVQHQLGAQRAWGYDLLNACNGFLAAVTTASALIESGRCQHILVCGGDVMSARVDYTDRNTCILFGDGCGAILLSAGPADGFGIIDWEMHSDGGGAMDLWIPASGTAQRTRGEQPQPGDEFVKQKGRQVFQQAVRRSCEICEHLCQRLGIGPDQIDLLVPHQANLRIIQPIAERLRLPMAKVVVNIDVVANTTAGTIPIALDTAVREGRLHPGSRVMLTAFGGGLTWGACYLTWGRT